MIESLKGRFWEIYTIENGRRLAIGRVNPVSIDGRPAFENDVFADDVEALTYVQKLAADGNEEAREALMMVDVSQGDDEPGEESIVERQRRERIVLPPGVAEEIESLDYYDQ